MIESLQQFFHIVWPLLIVLPGLAFIVWLNLRDDGKPPTRHLPPAE